MTIDKEEARRKQEKSRRSGGVAGCLRACLRARAKAVTSARRRSNTEISRNNTTVKHEADDGWQKQREGRERT